VKHAKQEAHKESNDEDTHEYFDKGFNYRPKNSGASEHAIIAFRLSHKTGSAVFGTAAQMSRTRPKTTVISQKLQRLTTFKSSCLRHNLVCPAAPTNAQRDS
jgi:hypothetical protein